MGFGQCKHCGSNRDSLSHKFCPYCGIEYVDGFIKKSERDIQNCLECGKNNFDQDYECMLPYDDQSILKDKYKEVKHPGCPMKFE